MNPIEPKIEAGIVEVGWGDRWQVYYRLQELEIKSECVSNQPLRVEINSVTAAVQLWSVVRQLTASRSELLRSLERSYTSHYPENN